MDTPLTSLAFLDLGTSTENRRLVFHRSIKQTHRYWRAGETATGVGRRYDPKCRSEVSSVSGYRRHSRWLPLC